MSFPVLSSPFPRVLRLRTPVYDLPCGALRTTHVHLYETTSSSRGIQSSPSIPRHRSNSTFELTLNRLAHVRGDYDVAHAH